MTALVRTIDPPVTPVTLAEAKDQLRILHSDDDGYITTLLEAATSYLGGEYGVTGMCFVQQTWQYSFDSFPRNGFTLPLWPVTTINSISYRDADGVLQVLAEGFYETDLSSEPAEIFPIATTPWPATGNYLNSVIVEFIAGFAPSNDSPPDYTANVPASLKHAIKLLVGHWYANREASVTGLNVTTLPAGLDALLAPYKTRIG